MQLEKTNFHAAKKFVEMKRAHNQESLSGPGSWEVNTKESIELINQVISEYNVKSILDLGCGDWNWFKNVNLENVWYEGWDADTQMIEGNRHKYGSNKINFFVSDIVLKKYPKVDLIICRDVLFHIDVDLTLKVLNKIKASATLLISTSFRDVDNNTGPASYTNFDDWGFYNINLNIEPFNLKKYEKIFVEEKNNKSKNHKRYISLYYFEK